MSFGENLRTVRKQRGVTQEELAELLDVSRQAISKWESGSGYPETEKLILLSEKLDVSLDDLVKGQDAPPKDPDRPAYTPSGKIAIATYDGGSVVMCQAVKSSRILSSGKGQPAYLLFGVDGVNFWGEHTVTLGWYQDESSIKEEIFAINEALAQGLPRYELKHFVQVEFRGLFGQPYIVG